MSAIKRDRVAAACSSSLFSFPAAGKLPEMSRTSLSQLLSVRFKDNTCNVKLTVLVSDETIRRSFTKRERTEFSSRLTPNVLRFEFESYRRHCSSVKEKMKI